jgi:hypothetical protein
MRVLADAEIRGVLHVHREAAKNRNPSTSGRIKTRLRVMLVRACSGAAGSTIPVEVVEFMHLSY